MFSVDRMFLYPRRKVGRWRQAGPRLGHWERRHQGLVAALPHFPAQPYPTNIVPGCSLCGHRVLPASHRPTASLAHAAHCQLPLPNPLHMAMSCSPQSPPLRKPPCPSPSGAAPSPPPSCPLGAGCRLLAYLDFKDTAYLSAS